MKQLQPQEGETWREYVLRLAIKANRVDEATSTLNGLSQTMPIKDASLRTIQVWELDDEQ